MKTVAKLTISILVFCCLGIRMVSADPFHYRQEGWLTPATVERDKGIAAKDPGGAIKPQTTYKQESEARTTKPYSHEGKGFGVNGFDAKNDAYDRKAEMTKVKLVKYEPCQKEPGKAFYKTGDLGVKKTGATYDKTLHSVREKKDGSSSTRKLVVWALKATDGKIDKSKVGKPETQIAFTKQVSTKEKPTPT